MTSLVVGGRGLVGSALVAELRRRGRPFFYTTRDGRDGGIEFDLTTTFATVLPDVDAIYIVAAVASFVPTERDRAHSWRTNVDGPIGVIRRYRAPAFVVCVSSDAVEYASGTELARQKAQVEAVALARENVAVVRPSRITSDRVADFARLLANVGERREAGLFRWT